MKSESPATDAVCFHMQQCIDKYLKAYLIFNGKEIRKTHDLAELISNCVEIDESFNPKSLRSQGFFIFLVIFSMQFMSASTSRWLQLINEINGLS